MNLDRTSIPPKKTAPDQNQPEKPLPSWPNISAQPFQPSSLNNVESSSSSKPAESDSDHYPKTSIQYVVKTGPRIDGYYINGCWVAKPIQSMHTEMPYQPQGIYRNTYGEDIQWPDDSYTPVNDNTHQYQPTMKPAIHRSEYYHAPPGHLAVENDDNTRYRPQNTVFFPNPPQYAFSPDDWSSEQQESGEQDYSMSTYQHPEESMEYQESGPVPENQWPYVEQPLLPVRVVFYHPLPVQLPPQPQPAGSLMYENPTASQPPPLYVQTSGPPTYVQYGQPLQERTYQPSWGSEPTVYIDSPSNQQRMSDVEQSEPEETTAFFDDESQSNTEYLEKDEANISVKEDYERMKKELEGIKTRFSSIESWAKSRNIDLSSIVAGDTQPSTSQYNEVVDTDAAIESDKNIETETSLEQSDTPETENFIEEYSTTETDKENIPVSTIKKFSSFEFGSSSNAFIPRPLQPTHRKFSDTRNYQSSQKIDNVVNVETRGTMHTERENIAKSQQHPTEGTVRMHEFFQAVGIKVTNTDVQNVEALSKESIVDEITRTDLFHSGSKGGPSSSETTEVLMRKSNETSVDVSFATHVSKNEDPASITDDKSSNVTKSLLAQNLSNENPRPNRIFESQEIVEVIGEQFGKLNVEEEGKSDTNKTVTDSQKTISALESSLTKAPEVMMESDDSKENVPTPQEKKAIDYSKWVDREKLYKKWAAEEISSVEEASEPDEMDDEPIEVPVLETKTEEYVETEPQASSSSSFPQPSNFIEESSDDEDTEDEKKLRAVLRTESIDDQLDRVCDWLLVKAKKVLLEKKRTPKEYPPGKELLDEEQLEDLINFYATLIDEYSGCMYPTRASYLAFKKPRYPVHPFQELMISHWSHVPLYGHRAKREAANIDRIVRKRMRYYNDLDTFDGQTMYVFFAILGLLDRVCLTADLLFLYGAPKSEALLLEHEGKYFEMVRWFRKWRPSYKPKPIYSEDLEHMQLKIEWGPLINFLRLVNHQCYLRIQCPVEEVEMDQKQALVYRAYMNAREQGDVDWSAEKTTKFLVTRLRKLKKIKEPSDQVQEYIKLYRFLIDVSSSVLEFDVYWFHQCLNPKNKEEWHCLKSDTDFLTYLFFTFR